MLNSHAQVAILVRYLFIALILPLNTFAQGGTSTTPDYTKLIEILPPSPNSASLGKYGGINVGMVSGMANINVSLGDFASSYIKVPLSVNYSSNGLKVDEIASRAGLGWSLNSGGVITRTVMGSVDEQFSRVTPPADFPSHTQNLINFAEQLNNTSFDGQPDLFNFNFNGYTGQFMLDNNLNPALLTYSSLKVEQNFSGTDWNFKVTAPDGIQYFFGGSTATETTHKYQSGCGRDNPNFTATAWYLNKIVHPNRDTVNFLYSNVGFTYITGVSQTAYSRLVAGNLTGAPNPPSSTCIAQLQTSTPLLNEINSTVGGKIKFLYSGRPDNCENLLTRIEFYQPGQTSLYKFCNLSYQNVRSSAYNCPLFPTDTSIFYRPFLVKIDNGNPVNSQLQSHIFTYNNLNQLPARLSFSQDDYGYFNGASNSSLLPLPDVNAAPYFTYASADRSPNPGYSVNGTLSKIQYPTGGTDSLIYEGNTYYNVIHTPNIQSFYLTKMDTGGYSPDPVQSQHFRLLQTTGSWGTLSGSCILAPGYTLDGIHDKALISVIDSATNTQVFSQTLGVGQNIANQTSVQLSGGHVYYLTMTLFGAGTEGAFNVSYPDGELPLTYTNSVSGGLRVSKIITKTAPTDINPQIKKYYYYNSASPTQSSGNTVYQSIYQKYTSLYVVAQTNGDGSGGTGSVSYCAPNEYDYYSMYSNPLNNLYVYPAPMYYSSVIESYGDNFANGGTEHHFQVVPDQSGGSILGNPIQSAPYSSYSWENGLETYACTFKMSGNTQVPLKKTFTHYKADPRINAVFTGYIVNKKYTPACQLTPPDITQFNAYDLASYSHFQKWMYPDTVRTWAYDATGTNYVEEINTSLYGSTVHAMVTQTTVGTSDGRTAISRLTYPTDTTLTGDEETARQALVSNYMIGSPIVTQQFLNTSLLNTEKTSYHVFPSGLVLPQLYNVKVGSNAAEDRVRFYDYNNNGKLLDQSLINGPPTAYQWGYNNLYPVAGAKNTTANNIFYDSFEEGNGKSSSGDAKTGHYSYTGTYSKSLSGLDAGTYTLSYWQKVNGAWTWVNNTAVTVAGSTYAISLSGQIDDVRFYPSPAQMTTYTYDPLIGMTSMTDAKGQVTFYEYDPFQRLMNVKDKDGNIVKHMDYHYKGQ